MKRQNIYKQIALSLLLLVGMAGTAWGQDSEAVKGDKYKVQGISLSTERSIDVNENQTTEHPISAAFDNNDNTWFEASTTGEVTVTIDFKQSITFGGISIWMVKCGKMYLLKIIFQKGRTMGMIVIHYYLIQLQLNIFN